MVLNLQVQFECFIPIKKMWLHFNNRTFLLCCLCSESQCRCKLFCTSQTGCFPCYDFTDESISLLDIPDLIFHVCILVRLQELSCFHTFDVQVPFIFICNSVVFCLRKIFVINLCFRGTVVLTTTVMKTTSSLFIYSLLICCYRQEVLCDPVHRVSEVMGTSQDRLGGVRRGGRWRSMQLVMSGGSRTCTIPDINARLLELYSKFMSSAA